MEDFFQKHGVKLAVRSQQRTVVDRLIQQSIFPVLSPLFERDFSDNSYGFRPQRSAHQALRKAQNYITSGYKYAVDLDLAQFFDTVNQSKLIELLSGKILDKELHKQGHNFVRYAADCMIFCKSKRAAERVRTHIMEILETHQNTF